MEEKIVYFEEPGIGNTEETLRLAAERAKARGISKIVLASTRGDTARLAAERWADTGIKIVVVPHQYGFVGPQRFPMELVSELEKQGHPVHFGTMLFHTDRFYSMSLPTVMATDGGHIAAGEKVIAVVGSGRGANTAVVTLAAPSTNLGELHITEIICKPLQTKQGIPPQMVVDKKS